MNIFCCGCGKEIVARLTNGKEIYPHRVDLHHLPFWKCDICKNYVGCHHKTLNPTKPLGCIPTKKIIEARKAIHRLIDPVWKSWKIDRRQLYETISAKLGYHYHTAEIRSVEEARTVYRIALDICKSKGFE